MTLLEDVKDVKDMSRMSRRCQGDVNDVNNEDITSNTQQTPKELAQAPLLLPLKRMKYLRNVKTYWRILGLK